MTFVVEGPPATKGSTVSLWSAGGRILTHTDSPRLAAWTRAVQWSAKAARVPCVPKPGGVRIEACCSYLAPRAPAGAYPTRPPDVDKVARALLDALTGIAYVDDAQVVELLISKRYGAEAAITITIAQVAP